MAERGYDRTDRVSQKLHEILARLLLEEVRDPRVRNVEITDVEVSPDLRHAQVFWVVIEREGEDGRAEAGEGLQTAKGFLKREIGERLETKFTPELDFRFDDSLERGRRIDELLEDVSGESDADN